MEAPSGRVSAESVPVRAGALPAKPVHGQDSERQVSHGADALLWDLDNVNTKLRSLREMADALARLVGPSAPMVAAARRSSYRACRAVLPKFGFELLSGGQRASGADRRLLERARMLRRDGTRHFVVASNDGDLARLARLGTLHVVTHDPAHLSSKLEAVAETISVLVLEHGLWAATRTSPGAPTTAEEMTG